LLHVAMLLASIFLSRFKLLESKKVENQGWHETMCNLLHPHAMLTINSQRESATLKQSCENTSEMKIWQPSNEDLSSCECFTGILLLFKH
jgi:hypothetical protein